MKHHSPARTILLAGLVTSIPIAIPAAEPEIFVLDEVNEFDSGWLVREDSHDSTEADWLSADAASEFDGPGKCGDGRVDPGEFCYSARFAHVSSAWPFELNDYSDIEAGRLDADGYMDFVYTGRTGNNFPNNAWRLRLGNGAGGFGWTIQRSGAGGDVEIADFNGDAHGDIVSIVSKTRDHGSDVLIHWGGADRTWEPWYLAAMGDYLVDVESGDLNADGRDDLIGLRTSGDQSWVTVRARSAGNDGFAWPPSSYSFQEAATDFAVADCDANGRDDVLALGVQRLLTYSGTSSGKLVPIASLAGQSGITGHLVAGDFDEDGKPDLVYRRKDRLVRRLGIGGCIFGPEVSSIAKGRDVVVADFDYDGHLDLLSWQLAWQYARVYWYRGLGNGNFQAPRELDLVSRGTGSADHRDLAIADFNQDLVPDLLVAGNGGVALLLSNP